MEKGQTNNPNGRPKGAPNKVTADLRKLIRDFVIEQWPKVIEDVAKLDPKERVIMFERLLQYALPKPPPEVEEPEPQITGRDMVKELLSRMSNEELERLIDSCYSKHQES
jgi:hypothetical protein